MTYYNNLLSLPFLFILSLLTGEFTTVFSFDGWSTISFWVIWIISGICGLLISLTTFLCLNVAGPTTYAIVGSLNKIPMAILGFALFDVPVEIKNVMSIVFGILAGIVYSKAKYD